MEREEINIKHLLPNKGQIEGLPTNPRKFSKAEIERLAKSIEETPELLEARDLIVYPHGADYVVIGGNLRLEALRKLNRKTAPCVILPELSVEKLKEIAIKDNGSFGEWDTALLEQEWGDLPIVDWGVPEWDNEEETPEEIKEKKMTEILSGLEYSGLYYEPELKPELDIADCINEDKLDAKLKVIDDSELSEERKEVYRRLAQRFRKIDFEGVANYYAFCASDEEKKVIERLRLVLVDDGVKGFIEDDMLRISNLATEMIND